MIFEIVKRVVRNKGTHAYLSVGGNWVADVLFARDFDDAVSAFRAVDRLKVRDVELVFMMAEAPSKTHDITIPIPAGRGVGREKKGRTGTSNVQRPTSNFEGDAEKLTR